MRNSWNRTLLAFHLFTVCFLFNQYLSLTISELMLDKFYNPFGVLNSIEQVYPTFAQQNSEYGLDMAKVMYFLYIKLIQTVNLSQIFSFVRLSCLHTYPKKSSKIQGNVSSSICGTHVPHMKGVRPTYEGRTPHK